MAEGRDSSKLGAMYIIVGREKSSLVYFCTTRMLFPPAASPVLLLPGTPVRVGRGLVPQVQLGLVELAPAAPRPHLPVDDAPVELVVVELQLDAEGDVEGGGAEGGGSGGQEGEGGEGVPGEVLPVGLRHAEELGQPRLVGEAAEGGALEGAELQGVPGEGGEAGRQQEGGPPRLQGPPEPEALTVTPQPVAQEGEGGEGGEQGLQHQVCQLVVVEEQVLELGQVGEQGGGQGGEQVGGQVQVPQEGEGLLEGGGKTGEGVTGEDQGGEGGREGGQIQVLALKKRGEGEGGSEKGLSFGNSRRICRLFHKISYG